MSMHPPNVVKQRKINNGDLCVCGAAMSSVDATRSLASPPALVQAVESKQADNRIRVGQRKERVEQTDKHLRQQHDAKERRRQIAHLCLSEQTNIMSRINDNRDDKTSSHNNKKIPSPKT